MNPNLEDREKNQPLHVHPGNDDKHDDGEAAEIIRHPVRHGMEARNADKPAGQKRGLRNQVMMQDDVDAVSPSKTRIKKQMHELRDLGKELTELGKDQLAQLDIPENLRDAIREMKNISKFGAQRRQIQYIGRLMRDVDSAPILAKLDAWNGKSQQHISYLHQLERWRDRLLGSDAALTEFLAVYPQAQAQQLRLLIRNAQKELEAQKPRKHYRQIFQVLRETIPEPSPEPS